MKRSEAFPTKFLSKDDISAPTVGIIAKVVNETLGQGDDQEIKPVMYFSSGVPKPMVVNNTNWINVESIYGDESDNWTGKPIEVWVDPSVAFGGKRIGGLRLRAPSHRNGAADTLTREQAVAALEAVGLTKDSLREALVAAGSVNEQGQAVYRPERDTPLVRKLVADNQPAPEPF